MSWPVSKWFRGIAILTILGTLSACENISLPRLSFDDTPEQTIPLRVAYHFDPGLSTQTHVVDACGFPYTMNIGDIVTRTFVEAGQNHFTAVATAPPTGEGGASTTSGDLQIELNFVQFGFEPVGRSGEEDRYHANVELQLHAVYKDSQGHPLGQTPLTYADKTSMWTPDFTSQSMSCATGQFDGAVEEAAEALAADMIGVIPRLIGQAPNAQPAVAGQNATPAIPPAFPTQPSSLAFRTMLQDANNNLTLEGGETLVLRIETTNVGTAPVPSAYAELRGTASIIDAFARVTQLPIPIGPIQPGETKTTEVRGHMPATAERAQGELVVSMSVSQGVPPGSHTILAAVGPGTDETRPEPAPHIFAARRAPADSPYFALVIGVNDYRTPWPEASRISGQQLDGVVRALNTSGLFPEDRLTLLQGNRATRSNIERTLFSWAKDESIADAVVLLYFAGHTLVDDTRGEVYLVPYEGSLTGSTKQLISLRSLQRVLGKLSNKVSLLFLDTPQAQYAGTGAPVGVNGSLPANWRGSIRLHGAQHVPRVIQIRRHAADGIDHSARLLAGLAGRADANRNGAVTISELLKDLEGVAEIHPSVPPNLSLMQTPLAR